MGNTVEMAGGWHVYLHKVVVDEIDDLQMSWQDVSDHVSGPPLKSLRQDGVVGVGTATVGDVPSLEKNNFGILTITTKKSS